ncbi:thermonuclease family protein [Lichenifustis flavocetrariae]|uniref:TNase-like domain-containing protein n=1 Tax=Lichenifustis flavocetrariae TaxID=2949735 RepID=A0AA41YWG3_9HYPH|nr:hypothetical protein [Lichenifustis flavocetrariae]MCW6509384.1 hypothetical protein [Lichenifustis flavocetrariae]
MMKLTGAAGWCGACALLFSVMFAVPVRSGPLSSPGCMAGGAMARVTAVDDELHLRLEDGRVVQMPGLDPPWSSGEGAEMTDGRNALRRWLIGADVRVEPLASAPDRWGRFSALAFAIAPLGTDSPRPEVSVSEAVIEAGFARARPDPSIDPCWSTYLTLESQARQARAGVWADPFYAILDPLDRVSLETHLGRFVIIEGRARESHEGHYGLYIQLADKPGGLAISIKRNAALRLTRQGADPRGWVGRRLRVRGLLDDRWGMQIDVTSAQQIELLEP